MGAEDAGSETEVTLHACLAAMKALRQPCLTKEAGKPNAQYTGCTSKKSTPNLVIMVPLDCPSSSSSAHPN